MREGIVKCLFFGVCHLIVNMQGFVFGEGNTFKYDQKHHFLNRERTLFLEQTPSHLKPYVFSRLHLEQVFRNSLIAPPIKELDLEGLQRHKRLKKFAAHILMFPPKISLNFFIKYKGVKVTKNQRPFLQLNYLAREGEIAEGFEASENLKGQLKLSDMFKLVSYFGVFEKWVNIYSKDPLKPIADTKVTATLKYAVGCVWSLVSTQRRKLELDFMVQQKTDNQWKYHEKSFLDRGGSGILFDHMVLTLRLGF